MGLVGARLARKSIILQGRGVLASNEAFSSVRPIKVMAEQLENPLSVPIAFELDKSAVNQLCSDIKGGLSDLFTANGMIFGEVVPRFETRNLTTEFIRVDSAYVKTWIVTLAVTARHETQVRLLLDKRAAGRLGALPIFTRSGVPGTLPQVALGSFAFSRETVPAVPANSLRYAVRMRGDTPAPHADAADNVKETLLAAFMQSLHRIVEQLALTDSSAPLAQLLILAARTPQLAAMFDISSVSPAKLSKHKTAPGIFMIQFMQAESAGIMRAAGDVCCILENGSSIDLFLADAEPHIPQYPIAVADMDNIPGQLEEAQILQLFLRLVRVALDWASRFLPAVAKPAAAELVLVDYNGRTAVASDHDALSDLPKGIGRTSNGRPIFSLPGGAGTPLIGRTYAIGMDDPVSTIKVLYGLMMMMKAPPPNRTGNFKLRICMPRHGMYGQQYGDELLGPNPLWTLRQGSGVRRLKNIIMLITAGGTYAQYEEMDSTAFDTLWQLRLPDIQAAILAPAVLDEPEAGPSPDEDVYRALMGGLAPAEAMDEEPAAFRDLNPALALMANNEHGGSTGGLESAAIDLKRAAEDAEAARVAKKPSA